MGTGKAVPDTLYCLDTAARTWRAYDSTQVQGTTPVTGFGAGMAADGDQLYLFGGSYTFFTTRKKSAARDSSVVYAARLLLRPLPPPPAFRSDHTAAICARCACLLALFGA